MNDGLVWEEKSKKLLKNSVNRRIRSIIGVSLEAIEKNMDPGKFEPVRGLVMKVCNDIARKLSEDIDQYTVKRNRYYYDMPFVGE